MNNIIDWSKRWEETAEAWFDWSKRILTGNEWPFSGNVDQVVHAIMEKISQLGFINISLQGSKNPSLEWSIVSKWSYGRQLGRIIELLDIIVAKHENELKKEDTKAFEDFKELSRYIKGIREGEEKLHGASTNRSRTD